MSSQVHENGDKMVYDLVVIGAGAGGCFAAIRLAELKPGAKILILEAARKPLSKVEISGGGRCNVTHACFDPEELIKYYPRGGNELREPFRVFQPEDLISWFNKKGGKLKTEADGRMFPVSDSSSTIINCFHQSMLRSGIELLTSTRAVKWKKENELAWTIELMNGTTLQSKYLLISSGSDQRTWDYLKQTGHTIIAPVPSLFTFNIKVPELNELKGISMPNAILRISEFGLEASGPLLITHWGISGPAVLKLSAWGARELYRCGYVFDISINWLGLPFAKVLDDFKSLCASAAKRRIHNFSFHEIPSRLWKYFCLKAGITEMMNSSEIGRTRMDALVNIMVNDVYRVIGKSTFKEEFVTAGGVALEEIEFESFESKVQPGLYLVGEVLNIDALTGGFNFQAAWTGAELVARGIAKRKRW